MPRQLSEDLVDSLLDKLSSDDAFRDVFQKNPRQALAQLGHGPARAEASDQALAADASDEAWACLSVSRLASKESIRASRDLLRKQLLSAQAAQSPIALETPRA